MRLVKLATTEDLSKAAWLLTQYAAEWNHETCFSQFQEELSNLQSLYLHPNGYFWLAIEGADAPSGCVALRLHAPRKAELKRLYVLKNRRGTGVGRNLLHAALEHARACGITEVWLETLPSMRAARHLYSAAGFVEDQIAPECNEVIQMRLDIGRLDGTSK